MREIHGNIKVVQMIDPVTITADTAPADGADTDGYNALELIALIGESGDTLSGSVKIDIILEESDDDTTYTAVTDTNDVIVFADGVAAAPDATGIIATIDAAAEDDVKIRCGYIGNKRYAQLRFDVTGTHTNGTPVAMLALLGNPSIVPTSDV